MFTPNPVWSPIGLTALIILSINIAALSTTLPSSAAAAVATSTAAARAVAVAPVAHEADLTDRTGRSSDDYQADAWAEGADIESAIPPEAGYRADGAFERDAIFTAGLTASRRLDAAAESAARGQARRAAQQAAVDQAAVEEHTAAHATDPAPEPAPTPEPVDNLHARAERVADAMPFDWRTPGITFRIGCHPELAECHWGTFDYRVNELWLSSSVFESQSRLQYVVAHELAHAWQWSTGDLDARKADLAGFGVSTSNGIEYGADCVAEAWGYPVATYWDCPADAMAHMRSVVADTT